MVKVLSDHLGIHIKSAQPVSGGCINTCYKISTDKGNFFIKHNSTHTYPNMFRLEAEGLELLKSAQGVGIPKVIDQFEVGEESYLMLEFIEKGRPGKNSWKLLGEGLAELHRKTNDQFGLDEDNYIGSLTQSNHFANDWPTFFREQRIEPQLKLASGNHHLHTSLFSGIENIYKRVEQFPKEKPSLLHGDLWSGNMLFDVAGSPYLVDPAVYNGYREVDIAMTKLFGGFAPEFYDSYQSAFPMEPGYSERLDILNLYPLFIHLNLFGSSYLSSIQSTIKRYG